jgi:hypothetical protein
MITSYNNQPLTESGANLHDHKPTCLNTRELNRKSVGTLEAMARNATTAGRPNQDEKIYKIY